MKERQLRLVEKRLCKSATMKKYSWKSDNGIIYFSFKTEKFYKFVFCDIFKILNSNDNNDEIFSYDDTLKYIENNKDIIYDCDENFEEKILKFWKENPDGIITFV